MDKKPLNITIRVSPRGNSIPVSQSVPVGSMNMNHDLDVPPRSPIHRRSLTPDGRLVSCLKEADRGGQVRRSRSMRVRFVRTPRDLQQQRASLEEGSVLVGRSPPVVHDRSEVTASSMVSLRSATLRLRSQGEGGRHGYNPPETVRVIPRSARPPVTVARVQVRGDLDTTVIGEVYRENLMRYNENLASTSSDSIHVPYGETEPTKQEDRLEVMGSSTKRDASPEPRKEDAGPKARISLLGERENIKVIYAQNQTPSSNAPSGTNNNTGRTFVLNRAGSSTPSGSTGGQGSQEAPGGGIAGSRMTAKVIIRRRHPVKEKQESDSESLDRIDVDHRPTTLVRRTMSLRVRPRQVWTPDQSVTSPIPGDLQAPPSTSRVKVRRSVSLRILPRREQQFPMTPGSVTEQTGEISDKKKTLETNRRKDVASISESTKVASTKEEDTERCSIMLNNIHLFIIRTNKIYKFLYILTWAVR